MKIKNVFLSISILTGIGIFIYLTPPNFFESLLLENSRKNGVREQTGDSKEINLAVGESEEKYFQKIEDSRGGELTKIANKRKNLRKKIGKEEIDSDNLKKVYKEENKLGRQIIIR